MINSNFFLKMININLGNNLIETWINKENKNQSEYEIENFRFNFLTNNKKELIHILLII